MFRGLSCGYHLEKMMFQKLNLLPSASGSFGKRSLLYHLTKVVYVCALGRDIVILIVRQYKPLEGIEPQKN